MTINTASLGTHFSDGLRMGPYIYTSGKYVASGNVCLPAILVPSSTNSTPAGIYKTPLTLLDIVPAAVSNNLIVNASTAAVAAAAYLPITTINSQGCQIVTFQGVNNVLKLDTPRNLTVLNGAGMNSVNIQFYGWDQYGAPMTSQVSTGTTPGALIKDENIFAYLRAVYVSGASGGTVSIGIGNRFGFPYYNPNWNYFLSASWGGRPDISKIVAVNAPNILPQNTTPISTTNGSTTVTITFPAVPPNVAVGDWIQVCGATATGGLTAAQLNILAQVTAISGAAISYVAGGTATGGTGGGTNVAILTTKPYKGGASSSNPQLLLGLPIRQTVSTSRDIRGSYEPSYSADGNTRLTLNAYITGADGRICSLSNTGSGYLSGTTLTTPLQTTNGSSEIIVFDTDTDFIYGDTFTLSGATGFNGVTAAQLNIKTTVTNIGNQGNFRYNIGGGTASGGGAGGGSQVFITPRYGSLYGSYVGLYGMPQYNQPLP